MWDFSQKAVELVGLKFPSPTKRAQVPQVPPQKQISPTLIYLIIS